jgi:6-phosphogluconolactonase (cycloisomerase 2 family)
MSHSTVVYRSLVLIALFLIVHPTYAEAQAGFVYVNDDKEGENTVSGFSVTDQGALIPIPGSPFSTGGMGSAGGYFAANRITSCIVGNFLYASNDASSDVSGFSIDPVTGVLSPVSGSPFPVVPVAGPNADISIACTPDGRFVIAATSDTGLITVFQVAADGALTSFGNPVSVSGTLVGIKVSPDSRFLAVARPGFLNAVDMFSIGVDGTLTRVLGSPFQGAVPYPMGSIMGADINCRSDLLFAGNALVGTAFVDVFSIDNGVLTPIPGSPFTQSGAANSNVVLLSPDDRFLFVSNQESNSVTVFSVDVTGVLTPVPGSPFPAPGSFAPSGMATDRSGRFLYLVSSNLVFVYSIGVDGTLTLVPGSPFSTVQPGFALSVTAFPAKTCAIDVVVDFRPGSPENTVNPKSGGVISVAILSGEGFDATIVDQSTVRLGPGPAAAVSGSVEFRDVDGDRLLDIVLRFRSEDIGIQCGDTSVPLTGQTVNGILIQGADSIRTVGCRGVGANKP